jgi:hypothetical protein
MKLHAPPMWIFVTSLIIAAIAVIIAFTPFPYVAAYGIWVAIFAYIVLAVGNLAQT